MADMAKVFKALGDPTRLAIYDLIRTTDNGSYHDDDVANSISWIASRFNVSLSTVSHHIKELKNAGLIRCDKQGQTVYCSADRELVAEVQRFMAGVQT